MDAYHVATDEERSAADIDDFYSLLVGPNGFECMLGEPEDRSWYRDGKHVVKELNRLQAEVERLTEQLAKAQRESGLDRAALFDQARDYQEQINTLKKELASVTRERDEATGLYIYETDYCVKVQSERDDAQRENVMLVSEHRAALARVAVLTAVLTRIPLSTQTAEMQREIQKVVRGG